MGAWCFVDLMGPADAKAPDPMEVGPHPHMGNFVARERDEITAAWRESDERTERFDSVPSTLERIEAPRPPWVPDRS